MTFLLFGDSLAPIQLVGMVLAGLGVAAVAWKPARAAMPPRDPI